MALELILVSDNLTERDGVAQTLPLFLDWAGITVYTVIETGESSLAQGQRDDGTPFSRAAMLVVHGSARHRYNNTGIIRTLTVERPDLRFILTIDPLQCSEGDFLDSADYHFVRDNLTHPVSPTYPVSVVSESLGAFAQKNKGQKCIKYAQEYIALLEQPLTLILACDDVRNTRVFADDVNKYLRRLGIENPRVVVTREDSLQTKTLLDGSPMPTRGIAVVHGSYLKRYRTVGFVRQLAEQTPDLRFIIAADEMSNERSFCDRDDYAFAKTHLTNHPNPQQQVCVVLTNFGELLIPRGGLGQNGTLDRYIRQYLALYGVPQRG